MAQSDLTTDINNLVQRKINLGQLRNQTTTVGISQQNANTNTSNAAVNQARILLKGGNAEGAARALKQIPGNEGFDVKVSIPKKIITVTDPKTGKLVNLSYDPFADDLKLTPIEGGTIEADPNVIAGIKAQTRQRVAKATQAEATAELLTKSTTAGGGNLILESVGPGGPTFVDQTAKAKGAGLAEAARREQRTLPAGIQDKLGNLLSVQRQGKLAMDSFEEGFVGKGFQGSFGGLTAGAKEFTGQISPKQVVFRKALKDAKDQLLRARSGAQINEQEFKRLSELLPEELDEPTVFISAMQRFNNEVDAVIADKIRLATTPGSQLQQQPVIANEGDIVRGPDGKRYKVEGGRLTPIQ